MSDLVWLLVGAVLVGAVVREKRKRERAIVRDLIREMREIRKCCDEPTL